MGKFDGMLICTDLDGTLLRRDKTVSMENLEAIEHFKAEGGYFTFIIARFLRKSRISQAYFGGRKKKNRAMLGFSLPYGVDHSASFIERFRRPFSSAPRNLTRT